MAAAEPEIAFLTKTQVPPGLEIRVNFGVFAGRQATPAEIDELARELLPDVGQVSIVAEERHEISAQVEASLHQVRIEVAGDKLPGAEPEATELADRLLAIAGRWARECIAERHAEVSEL
jgi:hypothetical protein